MTADVSSIGGAVSHHFSDGLYAKQIDVPAGTVIMKHTHSFSHLSILAKGEVAVLVGEDVEIVYAPACLEVKAGITHGVKAITDCVWFCIHATDEKDPDQIDEVLIKED